MSRRRGGAPALKIISWRHIPAQVNGTAGDHKVQVELPHRFQKAIDRAAMVAGLTDASSYVAEMTSELRPTDGADLESEVAALVHAIEADFPLERLNDYVETGGWRPDAVDGEGNTAT